MYDGVKAMIEQEKKLQKEAGGHAGGAAHQIEAGSHLKAPTELVALPKFPPGTKSLLMKHLTPEIWAKYHDKKDKHGFSFL
jgi:hypothetical protein